MVCAMVYTDKKLRSMTNYLVVSLSEADLVIAVVFVPFYIIDHYARTVIGDYFVAFILLATVFNLCGVTFERYIALTRPFRCRTTLTQLPNSHDQCFCIMASTFSFKPSSISLE